MPRPHFRSTGSDRSLQSTRGSVLMVALILAMVLGISLTSYLSLASHTAKMSNRSFYMDAAQNLCDLGIEQALWSVNNASNWTGGNFSGRTGFANQYVGTFPSATDYYTYSAGVKGQVKVWADLTTATTPHVVALATITLADGSTLVKQAEAYLMASSYFQNGMVGKTITFNGKVGADSWDSQGGPGGSAQAYSSAVADDNCSVGATAVQADSLYDGNGRVKGIVLVATPDESGIELRPQGAVGDDAFIDGGNNGIQPGHATFDFTVSFPDVSNPVPPGGTSYTLSGLESLPRRNASGAIKDSPATDGKYYYYITDVSLSGNEQLDIEGGNVVIITTNATGTTVSSAGNTGINIDSGSSLAIYTAGNVAITGNGVLNGTSSATVAAANQPKNFQIYGTRTAAQAATSGEQSIKIAGNGYLSGIVYAPNGDVTVKGGGTVLGAIVGHKVTMDGNGDFHYDESLANFGGSGLWKIRKWRELANASERAAYASVFTF